MIKISVDQHKSRQSRKRGVHFNRQRRVALPTQYIPVAIGLESTASGGVAVLSGNTFNEPKAGPAHILPGLAHTEFSSKLLAEFDHHVHKFSKDCTLLLEGDPCQMVYCVLDGWLSLSKSLEHGQTQIIDFALRGDIVDPATADGETSSVTINGLTPGTLASLHRSTWEKMITDWPELRQWLYKKDAARQARHSERMLRLGKGTAEMRVAYALLELHLRVSTLSGSALPEFHIPMTQQQIGDFVGLSSVHVCRTMRRMSRNGILAMCDHMDIRILNPQALSRIAGVDHERLKREIVPGNT